MSEQPSKPKLQFRWKRRILQMFIMGGVLMFALSWTSQRPDNLGVFAGQLRECPDTPNCVSTTATVKSQQMEPLRYHGTAREAMERLLSIVREMPRSKLINQSDNYLYVEFSSLVFRYIDDVEFLVDSENSKIDFRSASRVGYSDLGANRNRMKKISERFLQ